MIQEIALSKTETAYIGMVQEEHQAMVRLADTRRDQRSNVLLKERGIPDGPVKSRVDEQGVTYLVYDDGISEVPEGSGCSEGSGPADSGAQVSEKSTALAERTET